MTKEETTRSEKIITRNRQTLAKEIDRLSKTDDVDISSLLQKPNPELQKPNPELQKKIINDDETQPLLDSSKRRILRRDLVPDPRDVLDAQGGGGAIQKKSLVREGYRLSSDEGEDLLHSFKTRGFYNIKDAELDRFFINAEGFVKVRERGDHRILKKDGYMVVLAKQSHMSPHTLRSVFKDVLLLKV